jgi:hypothetical protein
MDDGYLLVVLEVIYIPGSKELGGIVYSCDEIHVIDLNNVSDSLLANDAQYDR